MVGTLALRRAQGGVSIRGVSEICKRGPVRAPPTECRQVAGRSCQAVLLRKVVKSGANFIVRWKDDRLRVQDFLSSKRGNGYPLLNFSRVETFQTRTSATTLPTPRSCGIGNLPVIRPWRDDAPKLRGSMRGSLPNKSIGTATKHQQLAACPWAVFENTPHGDCRKQTMSLFSSLHTAWRTTNRAPVFFSENNCAFCR